MPSLGRKEAPISVLVDGQERRFRLKAHSITKQLEQLEIQELGRLKGLTESENSLAQEGTLTAACRAYFSSLVPVVLFLLSDPLDGGEALTEADFWKLDSGDPERIIAAQEELTGMERVLGKALALQQVAGRRLLERLSSPGAQSEAPSPAQVSPLTATPPSTTGPSSNAWKRITRRVLSFGARVRSK